MSQTYNIFNLEKYATGRQTDVAIKVGQSNATNATLFLSLETFNVPNLPATMEILDATGDRSTNSRVINTDREHTGDFGGTTDVNKLVRLIYLVTGEFINVEDGTTGAYEGQANLINSVILPPSTWFYSLGAEGYRRLTGVRIMSLAFSINNGEAKFSGTFMGLTEDDQENINSTIAVTNITTATYQTTGQYAGLVRYDLSATDLSTVGNGDILDLRIATGFANTEHVGKHVIVAVDDVNDYVYVINDEITDDSLDETTLTIADVSIKVIETPVYAQDENIVLRKHAYVKYADDVAGLTSALKYGGNNFSVEINHNGASIFETRQSDNPLVIIAKNITISTSFSQIMSATNAKQAKMFRESTKEAQAYEFGFEDTTKLLGTSTTVNPKVAIQYSSVLAQPNRVNMHSNDEVRYDWTLLTSNQQQAKILINSEVEDPTTS